VIHHVSLEVPPAEVERTVAFWELIGFARTQAPEDIAAFVTWLERPPHQVHLIHAEQATAPVLGHTAIVATDFGTTVESLRDAGFEVEDAQELWGSPRAFALGPAGHRVELMAAPPG
jgi:catechol 2,3-dioxygenase-like lactoylglutathione lyase family enzyme